MNLILLGNSKYITKCYEGFKKIKPEKIAIIYLKKNLQPKNSYSIKNFAIKEKIISHETKDINSKKTYNFIKFFKPDLIFSSWPKIIKKNILKLPKMGVIGSHPTDLPINRGRHPLHWTLSLGIKKSALSFYLMDSKIDNGKIIHKINFELNENEDIFRLEKKIERLGKKGCEIIAKKIHSNKIKTMSQNHQNSNYLRKKNYLDLIINLKMNFFSIKNLVKSFSFPYDGAILLLNKSILRVSKIEKVKSNITNIEIGKIREIRNNFLITRCSDSIIKIYFDKKIEKQLKKCKYIYDPIYYIIKDEKLLSKIKKLYKDN